MNEVFGDVSVLINKRMYSQAAELLRELSVEQLSPKEKIEYEYLMGICFFEDTKIDEAISRFETCIEIAKNNALENSIAKVYYEISLSYFSLYTQN